MKLVNNNGKIIVLNDKGKQVLLTEQEQRNVDFNQRICNALGIQVSIDTLTTIIKEISEQIFYTVPIADFFPVKIGNGAWSLNLTTYRSFLPADDFLTGVVDTASNDGRMAQVQAAVDSVTVPVNYWAKEIQWNLAMVAQAERAGNWDLIRELEIARKTNWDLGIQKVGFLGASNLTGTFGLLNLPNVNSNLTVITKAISSMSAAELKAMLSGLLAAYRDNCASTVWPDIFWVPQSDFLGFMTPASADFPNKSIMALLLETFQVMTENPNFRIKSLAYADNSVSGLGVQRYGLSRTNPRTLRMDIPVDYTNSLMNTANGWTFQNVGYGGFTGVNAYRAAEVLYFDF